MPARRHHAVPRFHLARFVDESGLLSLHDLRSGAVNRVHPRDALVERYLYAPETGDAPHDDTVESLLAQHVDGPAAAPLGRLIAGESLTIEDRTRIAIFLAFQDVRVTKMRDTVMAFMSEVADKMLRTMIKDRDAVRSIFKEMGKEPSDELVDGLFEAVTTGGIKAEATKVSWFWSFGPALEIAELLVRMPWTIVDAPPGHSFITSDAPVVKVLVEGTQPAWMGVGWLSHNSESTFAVGPSTCLVIRPDGVETRLAGTLDWCRDVNRRTTAAASRFVVSRNEMDVDSDQVAHRVELFRARAE